MRGNRLAYLHRRGRSGENGKINFYKRVMEKVIPISTMHTAETPAMKLPQSGTGRMVMTAEPKFVPEEAVEIAMDAVDASLYE